MGKLNVLIEKANKVDIHDPDEAAAFAAQAKEALLEMADGPKFVIVGDHCIYMTDEDFEEFNDAACHVLEEEMLQAEVLAFLSRNTGLYYQGKLWGFNDTEVRSDLCEKLEEAA